MEHFKKEEKIPFEYDEAFVNDECAKLHIPFFENDKSPQKI